MWFSKALLLIVMKYIDDILAAGSPANVENFYKVLAEKVAIIPNEPLEVGMSQMLLGRWLTRTLAGFSFRHSEQLVESILELSGVIKGKASQMPGTSSEGKKPNETPAGKAEQEVFRTIVGKLLFMQSDRPDLQYGISELSRGMKEPTVEDRVRMKKLCRYLCGTQATEWTLEPTGDFLCRATSITAMTDSDWAKDQVGRKSVSGGAVCVAGACVLTFSRRQPCVALSSAEAELYALVATLVEARGIQQFLEELGVTATIAAHVDATAAMAIASRLGPGRLKHVDIRQLWVQQEVSAGHVILHKIDSKKNPADILTKHLKNGSEFEKLCKALGVRHVGPRVFVKGPAEEEEEPEGEGEVGRVSGGGSWAQSALSLLAAASLIGKSGASDTCGEVVVKEFGKNYDQEWSAVKIAVVGLLMMMTIFGAGVVCGCLLASRCGKEKKGEEKKPKVIEVDFPKDLLTVEGLKFAIKEGEENGLPYSSCRDILKHDLVKRLEEAKGHVKVILQLRRRKTS